MAKSQSKSQAATDILSLIEADHRQVEELFAQAEKAKGKKLQDCFKQIYKAMNLHAQAEEVVFYPAMREYEETAQYIEEAEEEHTSVKVMLEQMKAMEPGDEDFADMMMDLKDAIMHHVEEEESEIFDTIRECMDEEVLQSLGQEFQQTKTSLEADVEALFANNS